MNSKPKKTIYFQGGSRNYEENQSFYGNRTCGCPFCIDAGGMRRRIFFRYYGGNTGGDDHKGSGGIILIAIVITAIAYFISILLRFGISRKREYLADAGAADMTKKPYALANALRKISNDPLIEAVESRDVAQLFIDNPKPSTHRSASWDNMFATHPPVEKRIEVLEQFV